MSSNRDAVDRKRKRDHNNTDSDNNNNNDATDNPRSTKRTGKKPQWSRFPVRTRAHTNPLNDDLMDYPVCPNDAPWHDMYPGMTSTAASHPHPHPHPRVTICDVGCAYGGLLVDIAPLFPDTCMLGLEIREKVARFAQDRIRSLRCDPGVDVGADNNNSNNSNNNEIIQSQQQQHHHHHHHYNNIWVERSNAMRYLPNYFDRGQLTKIMFCFPDPHFKRKNYRRRIVSPALVAVYAYVLQPGGLAYTITDVAELGEWMAEHFAACPLFERVPETELSEDPLIPHIRNSSEDAQRTSEKNLDKHLAVFRRLPDPPED